MVVNRKFVLNKVNLRQTIDMKTSKGIKLFAPSCISLLSYGLRDISIAINRPGNEILAKLNMDNNDIIFNTYSKEKDDTKGIKDIVLKFAKQFKTKTKSSRGVLFDIFNRIPFNMGLGELEANITGVIFALNNILNTHFENKDIFNFIIETAQEFNLDILQSNVAANIFGGIILYNNNLHHPVQKLYAPLGLNLTIIEKRNKIDNTIFDNTDAQELFEQSKNNAGFIKSLFTTDHDLLANSLKYNVFDDKIAANINWYKDVKSISYNNEVYSIGFSHYGETVFIINPNTHIRDENNKEILQYFKNKGIKAKLIETEINLNGIFVY